MRGCAMNCSMGNLVHAKRVQILNGASRRHTTRPSGHMEAWANDYLLRKRSSHQAGCRAPLVCQTDLQTDAPLTFRLDQSVGTRRIRSYDPATEADLMRRNHPDRMPV